MHVNMRLEAGGDKAQHMPDLGVFTLFGRTGPTDLGPGHLLKSIFLVLLYHCPSPLCSPSPSA